MTRLSLDSIQGPFAVVYLTNILNALIVVVCVFMICLILIQRGKGGGLAGAFGGVGGSSAFGTKSGDVFTKVTMVVAIIWVVLSMLLVVLYNQKPESAFNDGTTTPVTTVPKKKAPTDKSKLPAAPNDSSSPAKDKADTPADAKTPAPAADVPAPAIPDAPSAPTPK
jgi:preprotein translocase subunit SecG